jgi:hypothetical protein
MNGINSLQKYLEACFLHQYFRFYSGLRFLDLHGGAVFGELRESVCVVKIQEFYFEFLGLYQKRNLFNYII